ncbi:MAG TPA: hypothetical protein VKE70_16585, partial [Candidatus Solibacter sp.]|nr:hypothetical protein [Candidatus Solibacter sp.]
MTGEYAAAIIGSHEGMMLYLRFAGAVLTSVLVLLPVSRSETKSPSPPASHPTRAAESREPELRFDHVTPDALRALADYRLAESQAQLERLHAVRGRHTVENTLQPYDDLVRASLNHWVFDL